jgi:hypothetical protein
VPRGQRDGSLRPYSRLSKPEAEVKYRNEGLSGEDTALWKRECAHRNAMESWPYRDDDSRT